MVLRFAGVLVLLGCIPRLVRAQDVDLLVQIEHVAGADLYLSAGTDDGIHAGDTLSVSNSRRVVGQLVVLETSSHRAITTFLDSPFNLTRGQQVRIKFAVRQGRPLTSADADSNAVGSPESNVDLPPIERQNRSGGTILQYPLVSQSKLAVQKTAIVVS